jgi:hypothetical protein
MAKDLTNSTEDSNSPPLDEFDPARLRIKANVTPGIGVKVEVMSVPVRRPSKQTFVRVHPDEALAVDLAIIRLEDDNLTYLVEPNLLVELIDQFKVERLYTAIDAQGNIFLWPVPVVDQERPSDWHLTHHEIAREARRAWVRPQANRALGAYEAIKPMGELPEPKWPCDLTMKGLLEKAFKNRFIRDMDHPVIRRLQGRL